MYKNNGFTLIEMMITVVIIGVLAAIAIPSYSNYVLRSHRSEGQALLNETAARMERYYAQNNTYEAATIEKLGIKAASPNNYYTVSIDKSTATTYELSATPVGQQLKDTVCGTLRLDSVGTRGASEAANAEATRACWK